MIFKKFNNFTHVRKATNYKRAMILVFFNNLVCPFAAIGCKILHEKSGTCTFLFPFKHYSESEETKNISNSEINNETNNGLHAFTEDEVECPICECTFVDEIELEWCVKANHAETTSTYV